MQDVKQLLHGRHQLLEGSSNSLSDLLIQRSSTQHRLLLLLLQEVRGRKDSSIYALAENHVTM